MSRIRGLRKRRYVVVLGFLFLFGLVAGLRAGAACAYCFDYGAHLPEIGTVQLPGGAVGVALSGSYGLVATSEARRLEVVDLSDPGSPQLVAGIDVPGDAARDVMVWDAYALVAAGDSGLVVVDLTDPLNPEIEGIGDTPGVASAVAVDASRELAYVADGDEGLQIIDLSIPGAPFVVGSIDTPGSAVDVAASGDYVYVADGDVRVIDVSLPESPDLVGGVGLPFSARCLCVSGSLAYAASGSGEEGVVDVLDLQDPASPAVLSELDISDDSRDIRVQGDQLFVTAGRRLVVVEVSDPLYPRLLGETVPLDGPRSLGLAVDGIQAYVGVGSSLDVIDVSHPLSAPLLGSYRYASSVSVDYQDGFVYLLNTDYVCKLVSFDVSDPTNPHPVDDTIVGDFGSAVAVAGGFAYTAALTGLSIVDISNPSSLRGISTTPLPSEPWDVAVEGNYAFVADYYSGLVVVDVSEPESTEIVAQMFVGGSGQSIAVSGTLAYVGTDLGSRILDVSDPESPALVAELDTGNTEGVEIDGTLAMTTGSAGFYLIDIADPDSSYVRAYLDWPRGTDIDVKDGVAYVAAGDLWVVDVRDPDSPSILGSRRTPQERANSVVCGDQAVHVADYTLDPFGNGAALLNYPQHCDGVTAVEPPSRAPDRISLRVTPNPTVGAAGIVLRAPRPTEGRLIVADAAGRLASELWRGTLPAGELRVNWDGRDDSGRLVPSGVYFLSLRREGRIDSQRLVVIR